MPVQRNFIFASCFLRSHFSFVTKFLRKSWQNGHSYKKGSLGKDIPSVGTLVGLLYALTWQAASALLGLTSLPSTSWGGLRWQSDWASNWLGACTRVPGDRSWGLQGRGPNSAASSTSGSLKRFFCCWWLACSNTLACPWWSLEGLLAATQNWPISYQKALVKTPQLVGILGGTAISNQLFSM